MSASLMMRGFEIVNVHLSIELDVSESDVVPL